ncbi:type I glyceraldehyde-3-phosphate dehydrogenase [Cohnella hashimotonis]|uniref:Glyceraldehyde-3-phosphate dehydrogenase n=1 Tax=Cohnella hashimotonis TaxID=2826895 RepID=A0ABT6TG60_9BACL|nr:type I glyceraldehyde-3-phosphate dehydrogenase [Cohnella hashimotonis]MDI4645831.1 type I glyceraldehyde-3-phosphate dehydrogenase [Cohnella hashimotonis]
MRIGLSGTGRIGRLVIRRLINQSPRNVELAAINSIGSVETLAHLLKYDTVHGTWDADIQVKNGELTINGLRITIISEKDPEKLPWNELGVSLAIDATGRFNNRTEASKHLTAGAKRVLLTAPAENADFTLLMGVNERSYDAKRHRILSAASCTTNCLAPVLHVLDQAFGIEKGWMSTVHAYTNDQNHMDNSHKDLRRARSCTSSIIPTSTGVGKALKNVLPHLADRIHGISIRVPVQDVSLLDVVLQLRTQAEPSEIREILTRAAEGEHRGILAYSDLPLVSADFIGNAHSAIIDGLSLQTYENELRLLVWYDNEWGYASRVVDTASLIAKADAEGHSTEKELLDDAIQSVG